MSTPITASEVIESRRRTQEKWDRRQARSPVLEKLINVIHQRPGGHYAMKIHLVTLHSVDSGKPERQYLVKSHTKAGAEKHVRGKIAPFIEAKVPTQDELVAALKSGIEIEDAYASPQASIPEPSQQEPQS